MYGKFSDNLRFFHRVIQPCITRYDTVSGGLLRKSFPDDKTTIKHVDEVLKLLSVMSGDRRYEEIFAENRKGKVKNMCEVAERLVNQGRTEGLNEGLSRGRSEGLSRGRSEERSESIERLLRKGKSPEEIHELLDYPMEEILRVEREARSAVK
jgi:predicted transposase YdaD